MGGEVESIRVRNMWDIGSEKKIVLDIVKQSKWLIIPKNNIV